MVTDFSPKVLEYLNSVDGHAHASAVSIISQLERKADAFDRIERLWRDYDHAKSEMEDDTFASVMCKIIDEVMGGSKDNYDADRDRPANNKPDDGPGLFTE